MNMYSQQAADCGVVGAEGGKILETVLAAGEDGLRRALPAADGRSDALAEVAGREARRVAGDEGVVDAHYVHVPRRK